jgi:hypothetical protein
MAKNKRQQPKADQHRLVESIPQRFDVWQADFRQTPKWVNVADRTVRPWIVLVTSRTDELVLAHVISEEPPTSKGVWDVLAEGMLRPPAGKRHRPSALEVRPNPIWGELDHQFDALGITIVKRQLLDHWDSIFKGMTTHLCGNIPLGILEMPGMQPAHVASFYRTAAKFYRRAPWRKVGDATAIKVECSRFQNGPWYAVVMGEAGVTFGLTLYEDLTVLKKMWAGKFTDEESARVTVALTVTFDDETGVPVADLDASQQFGWEVAGPTAYPWIFRKERGLNVRPPLVWELELLQGCLHAVLSFVARHSCDDSSPVNMTVPIASGDLHLRLSWIDC